LILFQSVIFGSLTITQSLAELCYIKLTTNIGQTAYPADTSWRWPHTFSVWNEGNFSFWLPILFTRFAKLGHFPTFSRHTPRHTAQWKVQCAFLAAAGWLLPLQPCG